jgi:lipopolysaccharide transport system ATP-binding protein
MQTTIRVDKLSKHYRIGTRGHGPALDLRETIVQGARGLWDRLRGRRAEYRQHEDEGDFWALKGVSFEVEQGEVLGIIGRNGAGKSTILKILSRVVEPTSGRAEMRGRLGSLLEVGTGFHPELTGRENIYLNGSILGMNRKEIDRKYDEIVAFSGIEQFIETPVKRYSSGMYVRLAFAVAAHLEPEILIVDEVLAVGDAAFQKKCMGRMERTASQGRTIIFVSHSMPAIKELCDRVILLDGGRVVSEGEADKVVGDYLALLYGAENSKSLKAGIIADDMPRLWGTDEARLRTVEIVNEAEEKASVLCFGQPFRINFTFDAHVNLEDAVLEVGICTSDGVRVATSFSTDGGRPPACYVAGRHVAGLSLDLVLMPGHYALELGIHHRNGLTIDWVEQVFEFIVSEVAATGTDHYLWPASVRGYVRPAGRWHV